MPLFVYNLTGSPVALLAGSPVVTAPASASPPSRGKAFNVTSEIRPDITVDPVNGKASGVLGVGYVALQGQVNAGQLWFEWTADPEYLTPGLRPSTPADEDPAVVKSTTAVLHVYADSTTGNDANSGLLISAPKKTLAAVIDLVPYLINHNVAIHLSGTFTDPGQVFVEKFVSKTNLLVIDGGSALTVFADNGGSPWTADTGSGAGAIVGGSPTPSWTPDAYAGYICEIVTSPTPALVGQNRLIQGNTATTITPCRNWSADTTGSTFRISRPTTTITASGGSGGLIRIRNLGAGTMVAQNIYLTSAATFRVFGSAGNVVMSHMISTVASNSAFNVDSSSGITQASGTRYNSTTFALEVAATFSNAGIGQVNASGAVFWRACSGTQTFAQSYAVRLWAFKSSNFSINQGSRATNLALIGCQNNTYSSAPALPPDIDTSVPGYAITKFGGFPAAPAIVVASSSIGLGAVDISNGTHGIEAFDNSCVRMEKVVTGSNAVSGVYAHDCANVSYKPGFKPILSGNGATVDLTTNGSTLATLWNTVDGGVPFTDPNELVRVNKYTVFFN